MGNGQKQPKRLQGEKDADIKESGAQEGLPRERKLQVSQKEAPGQWVHTGRAGCGQQSKTVPHPQGEQLGRKVSMHGKEDHRFSSA